MKKRFTAILIIFTMIVSLLPITAAAEDAMVTIDFYGNSFDDDFMYERKLSSYSKKLSEFTECDFPENPELQNYSFDRWVLYGTGTDGNQLCYSIFMRPISMEDVERFAVDEAGNYTIEVHALWRKDNIEEKGLDLLLNANGGKMPNGQENMVMTVPATMYSATRVYVPAVADEPYMSGKKFEGWYTNPECTGNPVITLEGYDFYTVDGDHVYWEQPVMVNLFAKWSDAPVEKYPVTMRPVANGSATLNKSEAELNDEIIVNVIPDSGYRLKRIVIYDDLGQEIGTADEKNLFKVSLRCPVSVGVEFEKISSDGLEKTFSSSRGVVSFENGITDDAVLDIRDARVPDEIEIKEGISCGMYEIIMNIDGQANEFTDQKCTLSCSLPDNMKNSRRLDIYKVDMETMTLTPLSFKRNGDTVELETTGLGMFYFEGILTGPVPIGDADGDGFLTAKDALLILKHAANLNMLSDSTIGDMDEDGFVTANDALLILKAAAGLK